MPSRFLPSLGVRVAVALSLVASLAPTQHLRGAGQVRGAHEAAPDPTSFTDELDLTVPGAPIDHPARVYPASDAFPTGPAVGARLPDFTLTNQHGRSVAFHANRARSKAIVSFQRSAVW